MNRKFKITAILYDRWGKFECERPFHQKAKFLYNFSEISCNVCNMLYTKIYIEIIYTIFLPIYGFLNTNLDKKNVILLL